MSNHEQPAEGSREADELGAVLGVRVTSDLLVTALTHRSYSYEKGGVPHNERLEFLGDAVLSIVVTDSLYREFPDLPEGRLAKMRASCVQMRALADLARGIGPHGLGAYLRLGRGEETTGGRDKSSILADTLEAVLGAIYLDLGPVVAHRVVHDLFDDLIAAAALQGAALDWKTSLQELTAELGLGVPEYLIESEGPDHERRFTARAIVAGEKFAPCPGRNKKQAEQAAAAAAWTALGARSGTAVDGTTVGAVPPVDPASAETALDDADPATAESAPTDTEVSATAAAGTAASADAAPAPADGVSPSDAGGFPTDSG